MSFAAITKVANIKTGDDKSKSVLLWLAFHLNDETGLCCPSISLLRKETEVGSDNTIRAALSRLREKGLVSWTREIEDGCVKRTLYTLNLDASKGEPASAIEPTSAIEVPQPLKGGTSTIEGGVLQWLRGGPSAIEGKQGNRTRKGTRKRTRKFFARVRVRRPRGWGSAQNGGNPLRRRLGLPALRDGSGR